MKRTKKSRSLTYVIAFLMIMGNCFINGGITAYAAPNDIKVVVNGTAISFSQPPVIENGCTLVPMRAIFEALGYTVEWDAYYGTVTATMTLDNTKREVYVHVKQMCMSVYESRYAQGALNSTAYAAPISQINFFIPFDPVKSPVKIVNGSTLLPTRAIAEALGCKVDWDGANRTVIIDATNTEIVPPSNWVAVIEAHCEKCAPDFLSLKSVWNEAERKNGLALSGVIAETAPTQSDGTNANPTPTEYEDGQKVYTVFDEEWNREFQYVYKNPAMPTSPPVVGSVPAVILIDESHPFTSYQDPLNPGKWIQNKTEYYTVGTTGGCNWYAKGRFWEVYGIAIPHFNKIFDTVTYLDKAELYTEFTSIRDVNDIRPYSIAVFVPVSAKSTPHVVFIEYVEKDASGKAINVYYTEANANNPSGEYRHGIDGAVKVLPFSKFIERNQKKCIGYIIPNADFYR